MSYMSLYKSGNSGSPAISPTAPHRVVSRPATPSVTDAIILHWTISSRPETINSPRIVSHPAYP
jgi:hypothetical protein